MKSGEKFVSENFDQVTLMHCDVPQFSNLVLDSTALQIVDLLNDLSDFYDSVVTQYDAYKIDSQNEITQVPVDNTVLADLLTNLIYSIPYAYTDTLDRFRASYSKRHISRA